MDKGVKRRSLEKLGLDLNLHSTLHSLIQLELVSLSMALDHSLHHSNYQRPGSDQGARRKAGIPVAHSNFTYRPYAVP